MKRNYYLLGIGMSAGGLQSLAEFLDTFDGNLPLAIILVSHLQPNFRGKLLEILGSKTSMHITTVQEDTELQQGTIYIIGDGLEAIVAHNWLKVNPAGPGNHIIDKLLSSLAVDQAELTIGMILSGTGIDGAQGLKMISEAGGEVLVQEPFSALYQSLPRLAIKVDHPDKILPPLRLAKWINRKLGAV
jgi:chemotaxis response regulator CheB